MVEQTGIVDTNVEVDPTTAMLKFLHELNKGDKELDYGKAIQWLCPLFD